MGVVPVRYIAQEVAVSDDDNLLLGTRADPVADPACTRLKGGDCGRVEAFLRGPVCSQGTEIQTCVFWIGFQDFSRLGNDI